MLKNANVHISCPCYEKGKKQTIKLEKHLCGATDTIRLTTNHIFVVMDGTVDYSIPQQNRCVTMDPGEMISMPVGTIVRYEALTEATVMSIRISEMVGKLPECDTFRFQRVSDPAKMPKPEKGCIHSLKANDRIAHFLEGIVQTERDGLKCSSYAQLLVGQLLVMIQVYYSTEEFLRFYSTVASPDITFHDTVREYCMKYRTINELSDAMGMNPQRFANHFRKVFGENPRSWLSRERKEQIYHQICRSDQSIREIAAEHSFSPENFTRYCRNNFGSTPSMLRERLCKAPSNNTPKEQIAS